MSAPGNALGSGALDLPPFSLDVESLSLGSDVKAVGMELLETESREPVRGSQAAQIWSAAFPVLAGEEFYAVDFFSHLDRVREFCGTHEIPYRVAAERCLVIPKPTQEQLLELFSRFEGGDVWCARWALQRRPQIRRWKVNYRNAGWTLTRMLIRVTHFAPFASRKMAGLRCSPKNCGPAK